MSMKRKAAGRAPIETPDPKRRKASLAADAETPESTSVAALKLLTTLKEARDKKGHLIATEFITLPDADELPEYYDAIKLPISVGTIEEKLNNREYPNLTSVESDLKRMVANAKQFNERTADIFDDAEKIRKLVSNHMGKINPAYKDPDYVPAPTPIPDEPSPSITKRERSRTNGAASETEQEEKKKPALTLHGPRSTRDDSRRASSTPAVQGAEDAGESFEGNTFQQAQEKIITEMMDITNDEGASVSGPFLNLPPRDLKDYYQVIKNPLSLKGLHKRIRGVKGREKPSGVSVYRSWQSLADDTALIWNNARHYNEDGSEISELATELQEYFEKRLAEAKAVVPEPSQPKISLKIGSSNNEPQQKLKISFKPQTPSTETNGVMVDSAALKRQQELVAAGANGQRSVPPSDSPAPDKIQVNGSSTPRPVTANGITLETKPSESPAPATAERNDSQDRPANGSMPPPSGATPRLTSGSPLPQTQAVPPPPPPPPVNPLDNRFRASGKTAADALITNLTIAVHPMLKLPKDFRLSIPPSPTLSQQSATVTVPASYSWIRVEPTFSTNLFNRPYKYFVCQNHQKLSEINRGHEEADRSKPIYDVRLHPGMNILEVEVITAPPRGAPKTGPGVDVEFEKTTVYVNVLSP